MILIIAVLMGIFAGIIVPYNLGSEQVIYVAIGIVAALDSVFGGVHAHLNKNFNIYIFISGFFVNALLAMLLTYIGNMLGVSLSLAAVVVFGVRIFNNSAKIRHIILKKYMQKKNNRSDEGVSQTGSAEQ